MPAAAIIGALGGIAQGLANSSIGNKMSLRSQKDLYNYTLPKEQEAQYNMIKNSPRLMVEGMKAAGLNPASITSGYQGSAGSGDAAADTQPLAIDAVNSAMAAQQMELNAMSTKAAVQKTNQETENLRLQNDWFERVQQSKLDTEEVTRALMKNQSKEIQELLPGKVKELSANVDLLNLNISYRELERDALDREYEFNGKKVKGSEIPYFKEIFALEMAQKTLDVDWFNAITNRTALDRDWKAVLTKEWFAPLVRSLTPKFIEMAPEVKKQIEDKVQQLQETLDNISQTANDVRGVVSDPIGVLKNKQDLKDEKLRENIRKAGRKRGLRYDKNGKAIYNKHGLF